MIRKVANLYEDYVIRPGCGPDLKRIAMWSIITIIITVISIYVLGK